MEVTRKPFQGVLNIIRFNWHFYVLAALALGLAFFGNGWFPEVLQGLVLLGGFFATLTIVVSLVISYYIYDVSNLYRLDWLPLTEQSQLLSINAGFDETSILIQQKYPDITLTIADFYDPLQHTEISIQRARKAYPPPAQTLAVSTKKLPFADHSFTTVLAMLSAHEIRDEQERIQFFKELARVTAPDGQLIVTEHLRDWSNFMAYNIGFLHFHSKATWESTFVASGWSVDRQFQLTPFITTFILKKHGITP